MKSQPARVSLNKIPLVLSALVCLAFASQETANGAGAPAGTRATPAESRGADIEIRFEFYPGNTPNMDDSTAPFFIAIGRDGRARALRYQLRYQTKPVASYEGQLPEAEVQQWFARVNAAFRLPKHRKDHSRHLVYEDDSFYLGVKSITGKVKEMSGGDGPRPDEVRALITNMRVIWKQLQEVPPPYAYLTNRPIEKDRLKRLGPEYKVKLTPIESLSVALQALLIPVVTEPRNFYPLTHAQYELVQTYKRPLIYKGTGHETLVILSDEAGEPIQPRKE